MTDSDSESIVRSVRAVIRDELEPLKLSQQRTADAVLELRSDVQKVETQLHGNGRPGLCERMALVERAVKSVPPKARDDMPSIFDLEIERTKTARAKWAHIAKIAALLIGSGVIGGGAGCAVDHLTGPHRSIVSPAASATR